MLGADLLKQAAAAQGADDLRGWGVGGRGGKQGCNWTRKGGAGVRGMQFGLVMGEQGSRQRLECGSGIGC